MIKAVLFDLDDTLYDYDLPNKKALDIVHKIISKKIKISKEKFLIKFNQSKKEVRSELNHLPDSHDRIIYFQRFGEKINLDLVFTLKLYDLYYSTFLKELKPQKSILKTFKEIKNQGIKIVIITNEVVEIQLRKLNQLKLSKYVDYFVASEDAGIDKPNKKIFLYALGKVKLKASEVLMVGDSESEDVKGARNSKIKSVLLQTRKNQKTKANYEIEKVSEVLKIIDELNN